MLLTTHIKNFELEKGFTAWKMDQLSRKKQLYVSPKMENKCDVKGSWDIWHSQSYGKIPI